MAKKKVKKKLVTSKKIDVDQILLGKRQLFLFDVIDKKLAKELVKKMIALDKISHQPIMLYINSGGGSLDSGYSIIDTMKSIASPVFTLVVGGAYSMAGLISIAGDHRLMTRNSTWMAHDGAVETGGKFNDVIHYGKHIEQTQAHIFQFLREHTKLSEEELDKAKLGQLWLFPEECRERDIVDVVIELNRRKKIRWQRGAKPTSSK